MGTLTTSFSFSMTVTGGSFRFPQRQCSCPPGKAARSGPKHCDQSVILGAGVRCDLPRPHATFEEVNVSADNGSIPNGSCACWRFSCWGTGWFSSYLFYRGKAKGIDQRSPGLTSSSGRRESGLTEGLDRVLFSSEPQLSKGLKIAEGKPQT